MDKNLIENCSSTPTATFLIDMIQDYLVNYGYGYYHLVMSWC